LRLDEYLCHEELIRQQFQRNVFQTPHFIRNGNEEEYLQTLIHMKNENISALTEEKDDAA
jgi:hypothetical protein